MYYVIPQQYKLILSPFSKSIVPAQTKHLTLSNKCKKQPYCVSLIQVEEHGWQDRSYGERIGINSMKTKKKVGVYEVKRLEPLMCLFCCLPGTPTEDTWPGIGSNEEFRSYLFPQYKPQALINHVPRYQHINHLLNWVLSEDSKSTALFLVKCQHPLRNKLKMSVFSCSHTHI